MKKIVLIFCMFVLLTTAAYAEEVEVVIPEFDVTVNGNLVDNPTEPYPFIAYKGITYIPMTWDMSYALGLELSWDPGKGLKVSKRDKMKVYVQKEKTYNVMEGIYPAEVVTFPVEVNGELVDNSSADYPLITFRNITYFPMTYDYMVGAFNSGYKWDDVKGLMVSADENLEVSIPEPYSVTLKVDHDVLKDEIILVEEMIYVTYDGELEREKIEVKNGLNHDYDGYYYNLYVHHYNDKDALIYSDKIMSAHTYESHEGLMNGSHQFGLQADPFVDEAYYIIELELLPIPIARAQFSGKYNDVSFEYYDELTLSYEDLLVEDAVYMYAGLLSGSYHLMPADLIPYAAAESKDAVMTDEYDYEVDVFVVDGEVKFEPFYERHYKLKTLDTVYVDPREMNFGLKLYKNKALVDELHKGYIKLYDKNHKLIKVLINKVEIDNKRGM